MKVVSEYGSGTTFSFFLPLKIDDLANANSSPPITLKGARVLYIDSYATNRLIAKQYIEFHGGLCDGVSSVFEAKEKILELKSQKNDHYYDVACLGSYISKESMRLNVAKIREHASNLKVIRVSKQFFSTDGFIKDGFNAVVLSPIKMYELIKILQCVLLEKTEKFIEYNFNNKDDALATKTISVLLVEDNAINLEFAKVSLQNLNCKVHTAENGIIALEILKERPKEFQVIYMDLQMPVMDGLECSEKINYLFEEGIVKVAPIIALTAETKEESQDRCFDAGMSDILTKPLESKDLLNSLKKWVPTAFSDTSLHNKKILLVEDNEVNLEFMLALLENLGCIVKIAINGEKAVEIFKENTFDAVLMDIQMPVMNGVDATQKIREYELHNELTRTFICAVTANALKQEQVSYLAAGIDDILIKPVNSTSIETTLLKWTSQKSDKDNSAKTLNFSSAIDSPTFNAFVEMLGDSAKKVVNSFSSSLDESLSDLQLAIDGDDFVSVQSIAHKYKSSTAQIGAIGAADFFQRLDHLSKDAGNKELMIETLELLFKEKKRIVAYLQMHNI